MYPEAVHILDDSAARLLVAVSDSVFTCARLQQSGPGYGTSAIPASNNDDPQPQMPQASSLNLMKACVSSSQAFASWALVQRSCNKAESAIHVGAAAVCDADAEIVSAEPDRMVKSILLHCQISIKTSMETGLESRQVSTTQLCEVLEASGRLLQLVCCQNLLFGMPSCWCYDPQRLF